MTTTPTALRLEHITKRFPGVLANDDVTVEVGAGEILGILGENGAGKSTLMNILSGLYRPDDGRIVVGGQPVVINSPRDAIAHGIGMVHQHFELVPPLTVAENIILGQEPGGIFVGRREAAALVRALSTRFGLALDPDARVADLSVGLQQRVEIVKALYRSARILILDEPTAVLTPQETREFFAIMRRLAADGRSLIFISHKLNEVREISNRIVVMRAGRVVGNVLAAEATNAGLATMMVGRSVVENLVLSTYDRAPYAHGPWLDLAAITRSARDVVRRFDVRTPNVSTPARFLSGGNQQKMVVARELSRPSRLLIAAQPTRGVDVGAIEFIHQNIVRERDAGDALLLISASLDEILALSDTIGVMYRGRMMGILPRAEANAEMLGLMMMGTPLEQARVAAPATGPRPEASEFVTGG